MKKLIALLLAVVMVMGLAACGSKTTTETKAPTEAKVDTPTLSAVAVSSPAFSFNTGLLR